MWSSRNVEDDDDDDDEEEEEEEDKNKGKKSKIKVSIPLDLETVNLRRIYIILFQIGWIWNGEDTRNAREVDW